MSTIAAAGRDPLARYLDAGGEPRELVLVPGRAGTRLLIDRARDTSGDCKLLAHLAADEPQQNARLVCDEYLRDSWRGCRPLTNADLIGPPEWDAVPETSCGCDDSRVLVDRHGARYRLACVEPGELRWVRDIGNPTRVQRVSARKVVGAIEDYEPVCTLTREAIERHFRDPQLSVATLNLELRRLGSSRIVLNRLLREAVLEAITCRGVTLSSIALACGRSKRDKRGRRSGETSWLSRRIGLLPDGGRSRPNPWVHSDVLGLIARQGLGVAPHEVELG
jgi:hypothetical protein